MSAWVSAHVSKPKHIFQTWTALGGRVAFAVAYGAATWLGMQLSPPEEHLPAVWPASGVLLLVLLLSRWRHWPVFLLLALGVGPLSVSPGNLPPPTKLLISISSLLEALAGAFFLRRYARWEPALARVRDVLALLAVALVCPLLSALPSITLRVHTGAAQAADWWAQVRVFWAGDMLGILLVVPPLLTWGLRGQRRLSGRRALEFAVLLLALVSTLHLGFLWDARSVSPHHPITYAAFPFILWAALRFEARGTSLALLALAAVSTVHTINGRGPFILAPGGAALHRESLLYLQSFLTVVGASGLLLAAAVSELRRAREKSERLNSELRASLVELAAAQRELVRRERMDAVGELSASVAHEVRNPLGSIANAVATLVRISRPETNSTTWELLGVVGEEVERLDLLISELVDFGRPLEPSLLPLSIASVVEGALDAALRGEPRPPSLEVTRVLATDLPDMPLDAQLLHRALHHLFLNALQAMPQGGQLRVELVSAETATGQPLARLRISDTGPGIAPDIMPRLFQPFFTTKALGTGLGLPIVRRIVEAHHGQIEVHSRLGQGTTLTLELPFVPAGPAARAPPPGDAPPAQNGMPSSSSLPLPPP